MPSCSGTEFEVIDQYLRITSWIDQDDSYPVVPDQKIDPEDDTRAIVSDQKLPQFSASFLGGSDHDISSLSAMEGAAGSGAGGPTTLGGEPWLPTNFLLPDHDPFPISSPSFYPCSKTYVAGFAGSGCTVIEANSATSSSSSSPPGVPFGEDPLSSSPDLYDLDGGKPSFYTDISNNNSSNNNSIGGGGSNHQHHHHHHTKHGGSAANCGDGAGRCCPVGPSPYGPVPPPEVAVKTEQPSTLQEFQPQLRGGGHVTNGEEGDLLMGREEREDLASFMMESLRDDIMEDCRKLNIALDPTKWTPADTAKWAGSVLQAVNNGGYVPAASSSPSLALPAEFHVPGQTLCRMNLTDFQRLAPNYGAMLYQRLEIWRMALDMTSEQPMQTVPQWYNHHQPGSQHNSQHPHHPHQHHSHNQPHYQSLTPNSQCGSNSNIAHAVAAAGNGTPAKSIGGGGGDLSHQPHHYAGVTGAAVVPSLHHLPLCISPAPSTDSNCSSMSAHSSSSTSSLRGRGGGGGGGIGGSHHSSAGMYGLPPTTRGICLEDEVFESSAAVVASRRKACQLPATSSNHHHHHHHYHRPTPPPAHHLPTSTTPTTTINNNNSNHPTSTTTAITIATTTAPRMPRAGKQTIHLWQFLRELLDNADNYCDCIKWTDRPRGIFKIEDSSKVARLWGRRKNRPAMNYDKLSRSVRQYYKKGIIKKTEHSKRLVYQFCQPYL